MKELHVEGVATHDDPESCAGIREDGGEAFDRGTCGPGIEPRNQTLQGADAVMRSGRQHARRRKREETSGPARSKTPSTYGTSLRENREISGPPGVIVRAGRVGKLKLIREDLLRQRHLPVPVQGQKVEAVVRGYFAYHAVPTNVRCLERFRTEVVRAWLHALRRRSQRSRTNWERMKRLAARWVPIPRVLHPYPWDRFDERTRGRSRVR